jgi:hypothetical protein
MPLRFRDTGQSLGHHLTFHHGPELSLDAVLALDVPVTLLQELVELGELSATEDESVDALDGLEAELALGVLALLALGVDCELGEDADEALAVLCEDALAVDCELGLDAVDALLGLTEDNDVDEPLEVDEVELDSPAATSPGILAAGASPMTNVPPPELRP